MSSSLLLRSFHILERQTYHHWSWSASWRLSNQRQLHLIFVRPRGATITAQQACWCEPDGSVYRIEPSLLHVTVKATEPFSIELHHSRFRLMADVGVPRSRVLFQVAPCALKGEWENEPITGQGYLEMYVSPPKAFTHRTSEVAAAYLLWLIPSLTVLVLLCTMIVLAVSRRRLSGFLRHTRRRKILHWK
jgi:hypothetical protein